MVVVNYNAGDHLARASVRVRGRGRRGGRRRGRRQRLARRQRGRARPTPSRGAADPQHREPRLRAAANQGIQATATPYVFLLNPDAEVVAGTLAGLVKVGEERPRAGAIGVLVRDPDGSVYPVRPAHARARRRARPRVPRPVLPRQPLHPRVHDGRLGPHLGAVGRLGERLGRAASPARPRPGPRVRRGLLHVRRGPRPVHAAARARGGRSGSRRSWRSSTWAACRPGGPGGCSCEHGRSAYRYFVKFRSPGPARGAPAAARVAFWLRARLAARRLGAVKAVVLVGGEGTRLRPLTETIPKPLMDFLDRPFLHPVLDHLAAHGVKEAVLSSPYLEATFGRSWSRAGGAARRSPGSPRRSRWAPAGRSPTPCPTWTAGVRPERRHPHRPRPRRPGGAPPRDRRGRHDRPHPRRRRPPVRAGHH